MFCIICIHMCALVFPVKQLDRWLLQVNAAVVPSLHQSVSDSPEISQKVIFFLFFTGQIRNVG